MKFSMYESIDEMNLRLNMIKNQISVINKLETTETRLNNLAKLYKWKEQLEFMILQVNKESEAV